MISENGVRRVLILHRNGTDPYHSGDEILGFDEERSPIPHLNEKGFECLQASCYEEAVELLRKLPFHLIITELRISKDREELERCEFSLGQGPYRGEFLIEELRRGVYDLTESSVPILCYTAIMDYETVVRVNQLIKTGGRGCYLEKPETPEKVIAAIDRLIRS